MEQQQAQTQQQWQVQPWATTYDDVNTKEF
jgi:hypothetical protein